MQCKKWPDVLKLKATLAKLKYTLCLTVIMSVLWIGLKRNLYFSEIDGVQFFWHWAHMYGFVENWRWQTYSVTSEPKCMALLKIDGDKLTVWLLRWCVLSTDLPLVTATVSNSWGAPTPDSTMQCSFGCTVTLYQCMLCLSLENITLSVVIVGSMWLIARVLPPISVTVNIPFNFHSYENHKECLPCFPQKLKVKYSSGVRQRPIHTLKEGSKQGA